MINAEITSMKTTTKVLLLLVSFSGIIISSCQKVATEPENAAAIFNFLPSDAACGITALNGTFLEGRQLTDQERIQIELMVVKPGEWSLSSDTLNGLSFTGSGKFEDTGRTLITLTAMGSPLQPGNYLYALEEDTSKLFISVSVLKSSIISESVPLESYFKATLGGVPYYSKAAIVGPENVTYGRGGVDKVSFSTFVGQNNYPFPAGTGAASLQKGFLSGYPTSTEADFKNFFKPGAYPFATRCGSNVSSGIMLFWTDANRQGWRTFKEFAHQTGSYYTIVGIEDGHDSKGIYFVKVRAKFSCKLYHPTTGEMVELTNGEMVSYFKK
jgi:hypothetical protein